jgi:hypothetical protein
MHFQVTKVTVSKHKLKFSLLLLGSITGRTKSLRSIRLHDCRKPASQSRLHHSLVQRHCPIFQQNVLPRRNIPLEDRQQATQKSL